MSEREKVRQLYHKAYNFAHYCRQDSLATLYSTSMFYKALQTIHIETKATYQNSDMADVWHSFDMKNYISDAAD